MQTARGMVTSQRTVYVDASRQQAIRGAVTGGVCYAYRNVRGTDHLVSHESVPEEARLEARFVLYPMAAMALVLLAVATPDVCANVRQFKDGLRTNLYVLLQGSTSVSRKAKTAEIGLDVARHAFPVA